MNTETLLLIAVTLGALARLLLPYIEAMDKATKEGKELTFQYRYLITFFIALLTSIQIAISLISQIEIVGNTGILAIIFIGISQGYGSTAAINKGLKLVGGT